ncbi:MAG: sulfur carrier protein [Solirubrobacteraceae bacterium]|jgi:sulfur carrier protein|nr:sulfur carrier protein [Solirubrobacteraceae bacterium]
MITVNGESAELPAGAYIADVLDALGVEPGRRGVAIAVDGEVVPRAQWDTTSLQDGVRVEVVQAIQGG